MKPYTEIEMCIRQIAECYEMLKDTINTVEFIEIAIEPLSFKVTLYETGAFTIQGENIIQGNIVEGWYQSEASINSDLLVQQA